MPTPVCRHHDRYSRAQDSVVLSPLPPAIMPCLVMLAFRSPCLCSRYITYVFQVLPVAMPLLAIKDDVTQQSDAMA